VATVLAATVIGSLTAAAPAHADYRDDFIATAGPAAPSTA